MKRLLCIAVGCLSVMLAVPWLVAAQGSSPSNDVVIDANVGVPFFGPQLTGTFTMTLHVTTVTTANGKQQPRTSGPWTFTGTVNGQPATAQGTGRCTMVNGNTVAIELMTVDEWTMGPLPEPVVPASITLRDLGNKVELRWDRLNIVARFPVSPKLKLPLVPGTHYQIGTPPGTPTADQQSLSQPSRTGAW